MTQTSPRAIRRRVAFVKRALPVLLLVVGALVSPTAGGIAWADGSQDPPALISVGDAKSADLMAQVAAYNESVVAQQAVEQDLVAEKAALGAMVARVNAALNADDAAGNATDEQFAELNSEIQAYNDAGPPGDPAEAAELDARGQELAAQQAQNNAKVDADNADRDRGLAAVAAHNEKATDYENTNQQLTARRATLMVQILSEEEAAELPVIATPTTVDSLRGMDPPQPDQEYVTNGSDNTAPASRGPLDWDAVVKKSTGETRQGHVALHEVPNPNKASHGVFWDSATDTSNSMALTNEAWSIVQQDGIAPVAANGTDTYTVPMGRVVGYAGGKDVNGVAAPFENIQIITRSGTDQLITAYPVR